MKNLLDWSQYQDAGMGDAYADIPKYGGNLARAVSVCINSHQCETRQKGVMCPSYRVTGKPELSTGGRVRLLKAALNGGLGEQPFLDESLHEVMDLCVACKGCKRECENEVDMAMLKIEYLAQYYQLRKPTWRTGLLANLASYIGRYRLFRYLPAIHNRVPPVAKLVEWMLGISAKRRVPELARTSFLGSSQEKACRETESVAEPSGEVVLLLDTFTNHYSPENAAAAIKVLQQAGYIVHIARATDNSAEPLCCGRSQLANGYIDAARHNAEHMLSVLVPHVEAGRPVIGLEPACLLAIRDDYRFLGLGENAEKVAKQAMLFEEFIAKEKQAGRLKLRFSSPADTQPVLVHGHCHQKAVGAMKSMRKVLRMIPGLKFEMIEASCCGMAGSFGIEKEHVDISMQMAEDALFPALRKNPESRVIANGFSCRHQIDNGMKRTTTHIAILLSELMEVDCGDVVVS